MLTQLRRKFFGAPNGAKPTPKQQTKLSFSTKANGNSKPAKERDEDPDDEEKPKVKSEGADAKENADPERGRRLGGRMCRHV